MEKDAKIYVAGHNGLAGRSIMHSLQKHGYANLVYRTSAELDLTDPKSTYAFFSEEQPEYVILAAAKVGGIQANANYPADFIFKNLAIQNNVIHASHLQNVKKLLFLGSSCIYPKLAPQPMKEEYLLSGELEPTNEAYAIAKIAGIRMCQAYRKQYGCNFIAIMPTNLYGINDNFDLQTSHALAALMIKFAVAKKQNHAYVSIWGTGKAKREFLHADDFGEASVFVMQNYNDEEIINVGTGKEIAIQDLAILIKEIVGFEGEIKYDLAKPDGTPRKLLDVTKMQKLGWSHAIGLRKGIAMTYRQMQERKMI